MPEVILNNFSTRLGHSIGRLLASLFPHDPEFVGRRVVTFHNQRDYIFFRHHRWVTLNWRSKPSKLTWRICLLCGMFLCRYQFKGAEKCGLQELGPRFTLKLRTLQKGTFDSKYGEYEWMHKVSLFCPLLLFLVILVQDVIYYLYLIYCYLTPLFSATWNGHKSKKILLVNGMLFLINGMLVLWDVMYVSYYRIGFILH